MTFLIDLKSIFFIDFLQAAIERLSGSIGEMRTEELKRMMTAISTLDSKVYKFINMSLLKYRMTKVVGDKLAFRAGLTAIPALIRELVPNHLCILSPSTIKGVSDSSIRLVDTETSAQSPFNFMSREASD